MQSNVDQIGKISIYLRENLNVKNPSFQQYINQQRNYSEQNSVYLLADYFQSFTAAQCYDIASFIISKISICNNIHELDIIDFNKGKDEIMNINQKEEKTIKNNLEKYSLRSKIEFIQQNSNEQQQVQLTENKSKKQQNKYISPFRMQIQDVKNQLNIHEKLHYEGYLKIQNQLTNEEEKMRREMQECTFQPNITINQQLQMSKSILSNKSQQEKSKEEDEHKEILTLSQLKSDSKENIKDDKEQQINESKITSVFERLLKNYTVSYQNKIQQTNNENQSMQNTNQLKRSKSNNEIYDRLYKESLYKKMLQREFQIQKEEIESNLYDFKPKINQTSEQIVAMKQSQTICQSPNKKLNVCPQPYPILSERKFNENSSSKNNVSRVNKQSIFQKLYQQNSEIQRKLAQKRINQPDKEVNECTFKPKLISKYVTQRLKQDQVEKENSNEVQLQNAQINLSIFERCQQFSEKRKESLNLIKKQIEKEITFAPKINSNSLQMAIAYKEKKIQKKVPSNRAPLRSQSFSSQRNLSYFTDQKNIINSQPRIESSKNKALILQWAQAELEDKQNIITNINEDLNKNLSHEFENQKQT